jgi:hypothetical protein
VRNSVRLAAFVAVVAAVLAPTAAFASTVTIPSTNPFKVPSDTLGHPVPFTIAATGFTAGAQVFVEQCDGTPPTTAGWDPTINCDAGSAPAPAIADNSGKALFPAGDPNKQFHPFRGASPSGQFNCLNAIDPSPANGLPDFRNCQVRVSTNNAAVTSDQAFFTLTLPSGFNQNLGVCSGFKAKGTYVPPLSNTDQAEVLSTALLKDLSNNTILGGMCTTPVPGFPTMHPKAFAAKLAGTTRCNTTPDVGAYPLNGKVSITMTEINPASPTGAPFQVQAYFRFAGVDPSAADVQDVSGIVIKGPGVGASVLGSVAQDAISKVSPIPNPKPAGFTGYFLDSAKAAACQAGTGTIDTVQLSTGTSPLGGYATGLEYGF